MNIDLDNLDETGIYDALDVEGHEDRLSSQVQQNQ